MSLEGLINNVETNTLEARATYLATYLGTSFAETSSAGLSEEQLLRQLSNATESREVRDSYLSSVNSLPGKVLRGVLRMRGYRHREPDHYVYLDLPEHVGAATIKVKTSEGYKIILAHNSKHASKLRSNPLQRLYVNLHEYAHITGEHSESRTDELVADAFGNLASKVEKAYGWLAKIPGSIRNAVDTLRGLEQYARMRAAAQYGR